MVDAAPDNTSTLSRSSSRRNLREVGLVFLRLGATSFGGPAAHIAIMEHEFVTRRGWLTRDEFVDLLGATNLIPGPNSMEMAIHIGYRRAGFAGLIVAGSCFMLPAVAIVAILAAAYVKYDVLPQVASVFYYVKPAVIAILVQAVWRLGPTVLRTSGLLFVAVGALAASLSGINELAVIFGTGVFVFAMRAVDRRGEFRGTTLGFLAPLAYAAPNAAGLGVASGVFGAWPLFLFFLKVGSVLFGSGYVLIAFLQGDLVDRWHWLTDRQLLDAIAVGQITPGPLFATATFIGYLLDGARGATAATLGIFLPAFFFVAVSGPFIPRLRRSKLASNIYDGVNTGSLAVMAATTIQLSFTALIDWRTLIFAVIGSVFLFRYRLSPVLLFAIAAALGLAFP